MKTSALSHKPLSFAVIAVLAMSSPAHASSPDQPAITAVVAFADPSALRSLDSSPLTTPAIPVIRPAAAARLAPETSRHLLTMVDAGSLPLASDEAGILSRLFLQGSPVLLSMNNPTPDDLVHVAAAFGIAPTTGNVILRRDGDATAVFAPSAENRADASALLHAQANVQIASVQSASTAGADDRGLAGPARHFDITIVDAHGEISGVTGIDVARSRTVSSDYKMLTVTSKVTIAPETAGVSDGAKTGNNAWTADLPVEYGLRHEITAGDAEVTYLDHFPVTDGRTEFTQEDTETRGFTIGGSTGSEISATGKKDDALAAKLPFSLSLGYEHTWRSSLTTTFQDYSIQATPRTPGTVAWKALIAPKLINVLVARERAGMPELSETWMTPMMRATTFEAMSYWKVPGNYAGLANVSVIAGYDLDKRKWWWNRADIGRSRHREARSAVTEFVIDLTDPYLSAEITVLIRSATGSGACLRDNAGLVGLVACDATDRRQMWGLDEASRYVNRGSGRCLTARPATRSVVTASCANVTFEKQWQWRADRLHSLVDHSNYRLYVAGDQVHVSTKGQFPDFPANFSSPALEPWTNYPAAPRQGIDHVVGSAGTRPVVVGPEYAGTPAVSDDQRWRIEVLRQGL
jgi:hypothetical protein